MMGFRDLLQSERGAFCVFAALAITVLTFIGKIDGDRCIDFMKFVVGVLVASKTVTTAVETHTTKQPQIPRAIVVKEGADK